MSSPWLQALRALSPKGVCALLLGVGLTVSCGKLEESPPVITNVSPAEIPEQTSKVITISGDNFFGSAHVNLSSNGKIAIERGFVVSLRAGGADITLAGVRENRQSVTFVAPATLHVGTYDVTLGTPRGLAATAVGALEVSSQLPATGGAGGIGI